MASAPMTILHVDMDAFYVSVEQRDRPELRGRPVIVGGLDGRGVVCAASYEARPFGVHSAMPMTTARRLCPQAVFLPVRMRHYTQISRQIRNIFQAFTPLVEPLSLDEAFLDVRGCENLFGSAPEIARQIKARVLAETGLVASVGVASNKFLAKLASDHGKPDGFVELPPDRVREFLKPLLVSRIWGVGAKGEQRLHCLGIRAGSIDLKIRSSNFQTRTRSRSLPEATNLTNHLWQTASELFERSLSREWLPLRLLGVGASRLTREGSGQGDLFETETRQRQGALDQAIDLIRGQFGTEAIQRGSLLDRSPARREQPEER